MSVKEIEESVSRLSGDELAKFSEWFDEFRADLWDRQIEEDVSAGKLDAAGNKADAEFEAGHCTPL